MAMEFNARKRIQKELDYTGLTVVSIYFDITPKQVFKHYFS